MSAPATTSRPACGLVRVNAGKGHSYRLDGERVEGVTTLIGRGIPKPALVGWAARMVAEHVADAAPEELAGLRGLGRDGMIAALKAVPNHSRNRAAVRGTTVHKLAHDLIGGREVSYGEELAGHVEACVKFMDTWRVAPVLAEVQVASRQWRYAGTADAVVDLPDGRRVLLDYKCAASGIFPEVALQMAAYRHAEFYAADGVEIPMTEVGIISAYAVWLRGDGSFEAYPVDTGPEVFKAFLHAAHLARMVDLMPTWLGPAEEWTT